MKNIASALAAVVLGLALSACTALQGGKTIVKFDNSTQTPLEAKAPAGGSYGLFASNDVSPKVRVTLGQGDLLGFHRGKEGHLVAVAGNQEFPLNDEST